ncbi:protein FAM83G isoform X2 [Piliocolobus tephrosceles]|uniref:protein FAM83G isoform X2 n=1 Tax=Piliocolobus tephrosceles TaxID=591936 RepID=UPI000E6B03D4|nr:protein FAM83G isoform X2 [Piliocolobus tephrosceles]
MLRGGQCVASPGLGMLTNTGPLVIAVVRDMSTDVDIFKDLLDTGFKRKAAVYIIMDESKVKYILHMFEWTHMRLGHLKTCAVVYAEDTGMPMCSSTRGCLIRTPQYDQRKSSQHCTAGS